MITIIEDTRQKANHHEEKHVYLEKMDVNILRCALPFGDYAFPPKISVDTKENIEEIAANITGDHTRFKNECIKARMAGCQLYILIETETGIRSIEQMPTWVNPRSRFSSKAVSGERLMKAMKTMQTRYGVRFMFCDPKDSAEMVLRILRGEFEHDNA